MATLAFPRYGQSVTADVAAEALHGQHGDLASSVYAMAMLFALDRAGGADQIREQCRVHDVVILDRYVASNAAYSAARLHQQADGEVVGWVHDIEYRRLGLPPPDCQVLLGFRLSSPTSAPVSGHATMPAGSAMPTSVTPGSSNAPGRCTPGLPLRAGAALVGGRRTRSNRPGWRPN